MVMIIKKFLNAAYISDSMIALPVGPHLNIDDMKIIAKEFNKCMDKIK